MPLGVVALAFLFFFFLNFNFNFKKIYSLFIYFLIIFLLRWTHVAFLLVWRAVDVAFNRIWRQGSICNYCLPQGPPMNFLNYREWKIIMAYHRNQWCNYPFYFIALVYLLFYVVFRFRLRLVFSFFLFFLKKNKIKFEKK
jgi:hypothetical protein